MTEATLDLLADLALDNPALTVLTRVDGRCDCGATVRYIVPLVFRVLQPLTRAERRRILHRVADQFATPCCAGRLRRRLGVTGPIVLDGKTESVELVPMLGEPRFCDLAAVHAFAEAHRAGELRQQFDPRAPDGILSAHVYLLNPAPAPYTTH